MPGSAMSFQYDDGVDGGSLRAGVRKVIAAWTSDDTTGTVSGTTRKIVGTLLKAVTVPGSAAPSDNYNINITDEQSVNVLAACKTALLLRATATTQEVYFQLLNTDSAPLSMARPPVVCNQLTIAVDSAGNSKTGTIILFYEPLP